MGVPQTLTFDCIGQCQLVGPPGVRHWLRCGRTPRKRPQNNNFFISGPILAHDSSFFQLDERNNFQFTHFFLKPIFNPLGVETLSKWGKMVNLVTFLLVVQSQLMMAHFFQLNEGNNFYLKHFLLKSIFTPLEGVITPELGKSR